MSKTPEWLTGATKVQARADGGTWVRPPSMICLHSTEGNGWPSYAGGTTAPHFTLDLSTRQVRQHTPGTRAGRALKNAVGGVETNRAGVVQVEIVGTCDARLAEQHGWTNLETLDDDALLWLGRSLEYIADAFGIPMTTSVSWRSYAKGAVGGSYGAGNGLRLAPAAWNEYEGLLGHMHVPENDHGDPGALDVPRMLALLNGDAEPNFDPRSVQLQPALSPFPLPAGHWFGMESRDHRVHSGYYQADRPHLVAFLRRLSERGWRNVPDVDRYTDEVAELVGDYQDDDPNLVRDERLGRKTWESARSSRLR